MLDRLRLARARRLNARIADRPALPHEMEAAVRAWERLHARSPGDWWVTMGLGEALMRRGNRTGSLADLRRALEIFRGARAMDDRPLARVGVAVTLGAVAWLEGDVAALREAAGMCAALRRDPAAPLETVTQMLVSEWQTVARMARLSGDPRDARREAELADLAEGMLGDVGRRLRGHPHFVHL
jgi:hypothetical protein